MFDIVYSDNFILDLHDILSYIRYILLNPMAAKKFNDKVNATIDDIQKNASYKPDFNLGKKHKHKYKKCDVGNYYLIFYIDYDLNMVHIARLIYSMRNFDNIIL